MSQPAYFSHYGGEPPRRTGARHPSISPYGPFRASDGSVFFGVQNEREWLVLCRDVLRRADVATDLRFATNPDRAAHHDELTAVIESAFAGRTAGEVSDALEAAGIANARLRAPADLFSHPQLVARNRWRPVGTPGGEIAALLPPADIEGAEPAMGRVPALGEHTAALRAEFGNG